VGAKENKFCNSSITLAEPQGSLEVL